MRRIILGFAIWSILCAGAFCQSLKYSVTDLGTFGGTSSVALALNNSGAVVGYYNINNRTICFLTSKAVSGAVTWASPSPTGTCTATGINDSGTIAGTSTLASGYPSAFRATRVVRKGRTSMNITYLASPYGLGTYAAGIDSGDTIVGTADTNFLPVGAVFLVDGSYREPGPGAPARSAGTASGLSYAFFAATGTLPNGQFAREAYAWDYTLTHSLQFLANNGVEIAYPAATDSYGFHPVGYSYGNENMPHAVQWSLPSGLVKDLLALQGSWATGTSDDQWIVGQFINGSRPFLVQPLSKCNTPVDLNSLLDSSGAGWTLTRAYAINNNHQIAGTGQINGVTHAVLLTPNTGSLCM